MRFRLGNNNGSCVPVTSRV
ncbi:hypothetical protein MTR67_023802 [Solanum verrucosum]|uniref:Uncharacterized protein n=1 Tax=Solanum verrucosum TaxID=315347 RepID=A0AAF0QU80_SOLVR|nr:hypothetical protein MTR67_023802 [Solanum verrucosum]